MDGLELGRHMAAIAFSAERYGFGGKLPTGRRSVAAILRGWQPREPERVMPLRVRIGRHVRACVAWFG